MGANTLWLASQLIRVCYSTKIFLRSNNDISPDVGHIRLEGDLSSALADTRPRLELPLTRLHDLQKDG